MNTAWTHNDLLVNLEAEIQDTLHFYGVRKLEQVPDMELSTLAEARLGDLVPLAKGRVGIVFDIAENRDVRELSIVYGNARVVMRRVSAK